MHNDSSKWAVEGLVNGAWSREHVGATDDSTLFNSREEAEGAVDCLAKTNNWSPTALRVVEVTKETDEAAERIEKWRDETTAMVFLDVWGSQSSLDTPWEGHAYTVRNYAPEWLVSGVDLEIDGYDVDHDECITVLSVQVGDVEPKELDGYRLIYNYSVGERECPECEGWAQHCEEHPEDSGKPCPLCEGDKYLYWGDEWNVCVYAPIPRPKHYIAGAGQPGCLYDFGPDDYETKEDAIEGTIETLFNELSERSKTRIRKDLETHGIHYFDRRLRPFVGHSYVKVSECNCGGKDHPLED